MTLFESLQGTIRPDDRPRGDFADFRRALRDSVTLQTDEGKVAQILRNFLTNAVKFTERGEIRVAARPAPKTRSCFRSRTPASGSPPRTCRRIFEEFGQIENHLQKRDQRHRPGIAPGAEARPLAGGQRLRAERAGRRLDVLRRHPAGLRPAEKQEPGAVLRVEPRPRTRSPVLVVEDDESCGLDRTKGSWRTRVSR